MSTAGRMAATGMETINICRQRKASPRRNANSLREPESPYHNEHIFSNIFWNSMKAKSAKNWEDEYHAI
jgi:hypothetical protein